VARAFPRTPEPNSQNRYCVGWSLWNTSDAVE
jgi:hypothetical protein